MTKGAQSYAYSEYKAAKCHFRRAQRQASETFIKSQLDEIDRLAEVNQRLFGHYVNHHRKRSCNAAGANINFDGRNVLNEREINNKWANFLLLCIHHLNHRNSMIVSNKLSLATCSHKISL